MRCRQCVEGGLVTTQSTGSKRQHFPAIPARKSESRPRRVRLYRLIPAFCNNSFCRLPLCFGMFTDRSKPSVQRRSCRNANMLRIRRDRHRILCPDRPIYARRDHPDIGICISPYSGRKRNSDFRFLFVAHSANCPVHTGVNTCGHCTPALMIPHLLSPVPFHQAKHAAVRSYLPQLSAQPAEYPRRPRFF